MNKTLVILALFLLVAGCQGGGLGSLNPFTWFGSGPEKAAAKAPTDPTQTQIAWTVAGPLGATAALLLISGAIMFLLGAGLRAFQSIAFGIVLVIINGLVVTFLRSRWTMPILAGTAVVAGVLLYLDSRDGVMMWTRKNNVKGEPA